MGGTSNPHPDALDGGCDFGYNSANHPNADAIPCAPKNYSTSELVIAFTNSQDQGQSIPGSLDDCTNKVFIHLFWTFEHNYFIEYPNCCCSVPRQQQEAPRSHSPCLHRARLRQLCLRTTPKPLHISKCTNFDNFN